MFGTVKAVHSGDRVTLRSATGAEMTVLLSHLRAPMLARSQDATDEPFAFASREFLRAHLIGKQVRFKTDYKVEKISATFATLWTQGVEAPVNALVAGLGWATCTGEMGPGATGHNSEAFELIQAAAQVAAEGKLGVHGDKAAPDAVRPAKWGPGPDGADAFVRAVAAVGRPVAAVLEQVINGSTVRVQLVDPALAPSGLRFTTVVLGMAGVACPRVPAAATATTPAATSVPGQDDAVTAVAVEARAFVETRLLHRDVTLHIGGADKFGNLLGRVEHTAGDIACELLRGGYGKTVEHTMWATSTTHASALRAAEKVAKTARSRLWTGYVPVEVAGEKEYTGRVVEVASGDTLVVAVSRKGPGGAPLVEERRVSLASVRAPRAAPGGAAGAGAKDAPYAHDAREWLRKQVIGKEVHVVVEYTRAVGEGAAGGGAGEGGAKAAAAAAGGEKRTFATVSRTTKKGDAVDLAVALVGEGLAEAVRHRADDPKASAYGEICAAEEAAKAAKKGLWSGKEAPLRRVADLSFDAAKARAHLGFLQRAKTMKGIVEHVFAGGRAKVYIPSEHVSVSFALAGVRCPALGKAEARGPDGKVRPGKEAEPFGAEAHRWMRDAVNNQDVEITVDDVDKTGTALGSMWVGQGGARKNVALELLGAGLATVIDTVLHRVADGEALAAAQEAAKAARAGLWDGFVPPAADEAPEVDAEADAAARILGGADVAAAAAPVPGAAAAPGGDDAGSAGGPVLIVEETAATAAAEGALSPSASFPALSAAASAPKKAVWGKGAAAPPAATAVPVAAAAAPAGGAAAAAPARAGADTAFATPCEIVDGATLYMQLEADAPRLRAVNDRLAALGREVGSQCAPVETRPGRLVAAWTAEGGASAPRWTRARIEGRAKGSDGKAAKTADGFDLWDVFGIDAGWEARLPVSKMRPLPEGAPATAPPLAVPCVLGLIRAPKAGEDYSEEAAQTLGSLAYGRKLRYAGHGTDDATGRAAVSLWVDGSETTVNEELVRAGYARVSAKAAKRVAAGPAGSKEATLLARLRAAAGEARAGRRGLYMYGDAGDSEGEETSHKGGSGGWARRR